MAELSEYVLQPSLGIFIEIYSCLSEMRYVFNGAVWRVQLALVTLL